MTLCKWRTIKKLERIKQIIFNTSDKNIKNSDKVIWRNGRLCVDYQSLCNMEIESINAIRRINRKELNNDNTDIVLRRNLFEPVMNNGVSCNCILSSNLAIEFQRGVFTVKCSSLEDMVRITILLTDNHDGYDIERSIKLNDFIGILSICSEFHAIVFNEKANSNNKERLSKHCLVDGRLIDCSIKIMKTNKDRFIIMFISNAIMNKLIDHIDIGPLPKFNMWDLELRDKFLLGV